MTGKRNWIIGLVLVFSVFGGLVSSAASEKTVVIGFTVSETGSYQVSSARQVQGLVLWMDELNAAGGIRLDDGTTATFVPVFYDDASDTETVADAYTHLVTEDRADFLVGPYSSGLTEAVAAVVERYAKIMIAPGAASDSIYQQGHRFLFQGLTPASKYLTGAIDLLAYLDPSATAGAKLLPFL